MFGPLVLVIAAIALMRWRPDLPFARLLEEWLARRPVAWVLRRTRPEILGWVIGGVLLVLGGEYVLLMGGPHVILAYAAELAIYFDAMVIAAAVTAAARVRSFGQRLRMIRPKSAKPRTPRTLYPRPARPTNDNDEEDRPAAMAA